ncbi:MAG: LysR family transcriptional regulator [Clostridiales bacterium]|nr:LysR family transcriptional regulator [Clostridiales bacterium]
MLSSQVKTFLAVAEAGSFTQAAQKLYLTPAAVMHQINGLEAYAGVRLMTRTRQGICLTPAGEAFYRDVLRINEEISQALERAKRLAVAQKQIIRVGSSLMNPCYELLEIWERISHDESGFELEVVPFEDSAILSTLDALGRMMDCFIGVNGSNRWRERASFLPLGTHPLRIGVPRGHRLYKRRSLTVSDLRGERIMLVARGDTPEADRLRDDLLAMPQPPTFVDGPFFYDISVLNECVKTNTLIIFAHMEDELHPSMRVLPVDWEYCLPYGIIYAKTPNPEVRRFVENIAQSMHHQAWNAAGPGLKKQSGHAAKASHSNEKIVTNGLSRR